MMGEAEGYIPPEERGLNQDKLPESEGEQAERLTSRSLTFGALPPEIRQEIVSELRENARTYLRWPSGGGFERFTALAEQVESDNVDSTSVIEWVKQHKDTYLPISDQLFARIVALMGVQPHPELFEDDRWAEGRSPESLIEQYVHWLGDSWEAASDPEAITILKELRDLQK
ncbi:MAG TPA: hypothetical protein VGL77_10470, partial [Armatimonadota bacterium]